jgi:hypothetical protein
MASKKRSVSRHNLEHIRDDIKHMGEEKKTLEREKLILNRAHKEAMAECEEIYQLKFGHRIPQEILDGFEKTPKLEALEKEFKKEEKLTLKMDQEAKHQLKETKAELLRIKKQNTEIIKNITEKGNEQLQLDKDLDATNNNITVGRIDPRKMRKTRRKQN